MAGILKRIRDGEVLLADGAMGSILISKGLKCGDCPEEFGFGHPEILEDIARMYAEAGADIVQSCTFGGSALKLKAYGLCDRTSEINIAAVKAARRGAGDNVMIAASIGPCGKMLRPYGDTGAEEMYQSFRVQIEAVLSAGADLICIETMTDPEEAKIAIRAAKDLSPKIPVIASMTFDETSRGFFTIMGTDVKKAAEELIGEGADITGSNCGNGIEKMIKIAEEFRKHSSVPIIIQSNAGLPKLINGKAEYSETPEFMAGKAKKLIDAGVSVIGGCCGTTPDHIMAFREALAAFR